MSTAAATPAPGPPRAEIARERRRQMQVRKSLEGVLASPPAVALRRAFYVAVGDYLVFSMERLHDQDQYIHDFLGQRMPAAEVEAHGRLKVLGERQAASRRLMSDFAAALGRLKAAGDAGIPDFEAHARQFAATFGSLLLPRKNPFASHTDALFGDGDWVTIAGVTPASLAEEQRLFRAVQAAAPPGMDPERFTGEHPPG